MDDIHDLDAEDVQNFQRGIDREGCFNRLTKRHEKAVERFVARQGRSPSGPADITQKVFLHAYQKLDGLRTAGAIRKWLYAIAYREWIADCAKGNHDPLVHSNGDLAIGTASAASRTPEESSIVEEELEAVSDAIDSLPRQERLCFCLVCVEQHSYREAADLLHLSIGTVKAHVDHARTKLQRILGPDWRDYLP